AVHLAILRADPKLGHPAGNGSVPAARVPAAPAPAASAPASAPAPPASADPVPAGPGPADPVPATPRTSNLPAQLTSFVGRDEELNRVSKLLGEGRLVILTGPGGTGKTRLAIEAVARLAAGMADGGWVVPPGPGGGARDG